MIKDGSVVDNFSSKDKIAAFPISNGKVISFLLVLLGQQYTLPDYLCFDCTYWHLLLAGTDVMDCRMYGDALATYYVHFASQTLPNMEEPGIDIDSQVLHSEVLTRL